MANEGFSVNNECIGIVLAGGKSSRMGRDKALLFRKEQEHMLAFSKHLLAETGIRRVVVSGDQHGISDLIKDAGPLSGIYSALHQTPCAAALILPVDLPLMTADALAKLRITGELSNKACFYQNNALPLYLPNNAFTELFFNQVFRNAKQPLSEKGPSMRQMLAAIPHQSLTIANELWLKNTNTPEEWQQAQQQLSRVGNL